VAVCGQQRMQPAMSEVLVLAQVAIRLVQPASMNWRFQLPTEVSPTRCSRAACTTVILPPRTSMTMRSFTSTGNAGGRPTFHHPRPEPVDGACHCAGWRRVDCMLFPCSARVDEADNAHAIADRCAGGVVVPKGPRPIMRLSVVAREVMACLNMHRGVEPPDRNEVQVGAGSLDPRDPSSA